MASFSILSKRMINIYHLPKLLQIKAVQRIVKVMQRKEEIGKRVIMRLPMICQHGEARKLMRSKNIMNIIFRFTRCTEEGVRPIAQTIILVLDA